MRVDDHDTFFFFSGVSRDFYGRKNYNILIYYILDAWRTSYVFNTRYKFRKIYYIVIHILSRSFDCPPVTYTSGRFLPKTSHPKQ